MENKNFVTIDHRRNIDQSFNTISKIDTKDISLDVLRGRIGDKSLCLIENTIQSDNTILKTKYPSDLITRRRDSVIKINSRASSMRPETGRKLDEEIDKII